MIWIFKILCIFVLSSFVRAEWPENVRAFLFAQKISGVALPSVSYNDLLSPDKGLDNGEGDTVFLLPVLYFNKMSKTLSSATAQEVAKVAKKNHKLSRGSLTYTMFQKSIPELVAVFEIEMDCKNQAYFFILENGHFEAFREYCQEERSQS